MEFITPYITVLLPVYNTELYIEEALKSILNQSFKNFECIIIDDASTDNTVKIIESFKDDRIILIKKEVNCGYTKNLNEGLQLSKGKYIARMDADDISHPDRFLKQINFFKNNPDVVLCGTQYKVIGQNKYSNHPTSHENIKIGLINGSLIAHPTVMMCKTFLIENNLFYDITKEPAEDHDLWSRIVFLGKVANIDENLLEYRIHNSQVSSKRKKSQIKVSREIKTRMLKMLLPEFELLNENNYTDLNKEVVFANYKKQITQFRALIKQNNRQLLYAKKPFNEFCNHEIKLLDYKLIEKFENNSFFILKKQCFNFNFFKNLGFFLSLKFIIKSLFIKKYK